MTFLRSYGTAQEEEFRELAERSVSRLPSTLSKPVASLMREVEKGNFSAGMNYALDFLEISVQFVSCCLFVLLQDAEKELPEDAKAMKAIVDKIDSKRALSFGDWVNDIFNPAVRAALKELPGNPLVRSLDAALFVRGANRLLGTKTEPSVVRIRNEYKGHSTTLSNEIYRGVVFTLEPQILAMLKAVEPLQEFSFNFSDGGGSLLLVKARWALFPAEAQHAFGHGAGTHENDLPAHGAKRGDLRRPAFDGGLVESAAVVRDERAAHFDDNASGVLE